MMEDPRTAGRWYQFPPPLAPRYRVSHWQGMQTLNADLNLYKLPKDKGIFREVVPPNTIGSPVRMERRGADIFRVEPIAFIPRPPFLYLI